MTKIEFDFRKAKLTYIFATLSLSLSLSLWGFDDVSQGHLYYHFINKKKIIILIAT